MQEEGGTALRELYLRRFYSGSRPRNTLEKVISFQQKLQDFRTPKHPQTTHPEHNQLLQEDTARFRPSTNHSTHHPRRERNAFSHENKRIEGPALAELRLILDRRDGEPQQGESRGEKGVSTAQGRRRMLSQREMSRQEGDHEEHLAKINMTSFLQDRKLTSSEKKTRPLIYLRRECVSVKENPHEQHEHEHEIPSNKIVSRKVFIGGRDLEKAAEEYFKHYRENTKKIENAEASKREKMTPPISDRRVIDKVKSSRRGYRRSKVAAPSQNVKGGPRTEPKAPKYEDMMINLDLDPWNVEADYF